jgi:hypothetical protein
VDGEREFIGRASDVEDTRRSAETERNIDRIEFRLPQNLRSNEQAQEGEGALVPLELVQNHRSTEQAQGGADDDIRVQGGHRCGQTRLIESKKSCEPGKREIRELRRRRCSNEKVRLSYGNIF